MKQWIQDFWPDILFQTPNNETFFLQPLIDGNSVTFQ